MTYKQPSDAHNERIAMMTISSLYPVLLHKVEIKGRTEEELLAVIEWLTGFDKNGVYKAIAAHESLKEFFESAKIHPDAAKIKGLICGYRVEQIENPLTQQVRYLDKLVDELAKGKKLEKILNRK